MDPKVFLFLIVATTLETFGDAIVRLGIRQDAWLPRTGLFMAGAILLFGYGLSLNIPPIEFNRVVGLYIATLFVVWQIVNLIVFRTGPELRESKRAAARFLPWGKKRRRTKRT
jgi:hypothetical protein